MSVTVFEKMLNVRRPVLGMRTIFSQKARSYPIYHHVCGSHNIGLFYNRKKKKDHSKTRARKYILMANGINRTLSRDAKVNCDGGNNNAVDENILFQ